MGVNSFYLFRKHSTGWIGFSKHCIHHVSIVFGFIFKIAKALSGVHYTFTNQAITGMVYILDSLNTCGADPLLLEYFKDDWNRMIIQYSSFRFGGRCFFISNRRKGFINKKGGEDMGYCLLVDLQMKNGRQMYLSQNLRLIRNLMILRKNRATYFLKKYPL